MRKPISTWLAFAFLAGCSADVYETTGSGLTGRCEPQDARGNGPCQAILGVRFDGESCHYLSGCSCVGADCNELYSDLETCEAETASCAEPAGSPCGGLLGRLCPAGQFCDYTAAQACGAADQQGVCAAIPRFCPAVAGPPACGCDGTTYPTACAANAAGVAVASPGACTTDGASCDPQDVRGVGPCAAILGVRFDGESCRYLSGCRCVGRDCDALYEDIETCEADHRACAAPEEPVSCDPQDARGVGPCAAILGVRWDGSECRAFSGCRCRGEDCDALYDSIESCEAAHDTCSAPPSDCRTGGCRAGTYCSFCWGTYQCIPRGAVC